MATISTTTNTTPFQFPSNSYIDRDPNTGYLWALVKTSTANRYDLFRSTDGGASWATRANFTRANIQEFSGLHFGKVNWVHTSYRTNESSQDRIYYRRFSDVFVAWESEVLLAAFGNGGVGGAVYSGLDLMIAISAERTEKVCVAAGTIDGGVGPRGVALYGAYTPWAGATVASNAIFAGQRKWFPEAGSSGRITPCLDLEHTGDGKSWTTPNLWLTFGRDNLYVMKLAWHGYGWTGPNSPILVASGLAAQNWNMGRFDGNRFVMAARSVAPTDTVTIYDRNKANSTTTPWTTPAHPTGAIRALALNYNKVTGDARVFAVGTSTGVLYYIDFVRATNTWTSWAQVTATAVLGANVDNFGVRRGTHATSKHHVYIAHSGAPNTLVEYQQGLAYAPTQPTWITAGQAYVNGGPADVASTLPLDWQFNDPDPTDVQTAYALSRQIGAGALAYYRASDATWQATEQKNLTATTIVTLAAAWALDADANYTFKVKAWDSADVASAYSDPLVLTPSAKVNPAITSPAEASVYASDTLVVTWTAAQQTAYKVELYIFGILVGDTGWITSTSTTHTMLSPLLANGFNYSVRVLTKNNEGLISDFSQKNFSVAFTPPATPTLAITPSAANGWNAVVITNPAPSGGQPAVTDQDVYRRKTGTTDAIRIAAGVANNGTWNDWRAVSRQAYEYQVFTRGANGSTATSAWTS